MRVNDVVALADLGALHQRPARSFKQLEPTLDRERIAHLIQTLTDVAARDARHGHRHFEMGVWVWPNAAADCRTVACALGHEALTPWARKRGLSVDSDGVPSFKGSTDLDAACRWFGLTYDVAQALFWATAYDNDGRRFEVTDDGIIAFTSTTPQQVIARFEYLLQVGPEQFESELLRLGVTKLPGGCEAAP